MTAIHRMTTEQVVCHAVPSLDSLWTTYAYVSWLEELLAVMGA